MATLRQRQGVIMCDASGKAHEVIKASKAGARRRWANGEGVWMEVCKQASWADGRDAHFVPCDGKFCDAEKEFKEWHSTPWTGREVAYFITREKQ